MISDRGIGHVALTGAPGWLASSLLDALSTDSSVAAVDALVHPALFPSKPVSIHPCVGRVFAHDLADSTSNICPALEGAETVIHCAGIIHVKRTRDWYEINTRGTIRLAQAARAAGVKRFIFVSSNAAGGRSRSCDHLLTEADPPNPTSHYGRSKWAAEQGLMKLHEPGAFEVVILRPSMFYGPPVPQRHIDVYRRILKGHFPIVGGGAYRRSITYIDHLVQAVLLACKRQRAAGETYYVVDKQPYTTLEICEAMAQALGVPLKKLWLPSLMGRLAYSSDCLLASAGIYWQSLHLLGESHWHVGISCDKLQQELGYSPSVDLDEGMKRAVAWCRQNRRL